jgi:hypothetical protein
VPLGAAAVGTFIGLVAFFALCDNDSDSCPGGNASTELELQLWLGLAGLVAMGAMAWATFSGRRRSAWLLLVVALALYAGEAVFQDLATHGEFTLLSA